MAEPAPLPPGARAEPNPHPRDAEVEEAARDLLTFLGAWHLRHRLTQAEYMYLLAVPVHRQLQRICVEERTAPLPISTVPPPAMTPEQLADAVGAK